LPVHAWALQRPQEACRDRPLNLIGGRAGRRVAGSWEEYLAVNDEADLRDTDVSARRERAGQALS